jgi:hypothetical protein
MGGCISKTKDIRDLNNNSGEGKRKEDAPPDLIRLTQQRQEDFSSYCPETSDRSSADFNLVQSRVRLENGEKVPVGDIVSTLITLKDLCDQASRERSENIFNMKTGMPLMELYTACEVPNYRMYDDWQKVLTETGLIDKNTKQPSASVRNIVLSFFKDNVAIRDGEFFSQNLELVKLRNGSEYTHDEVKKVMDVLNEIYKQNGNYISKLYDFSKRKERKLDKSTAKVLESRGLIDQQTRRPNASVRDVVLSSFDKESGQLHSPAIPLDELVKMALKSFQKSPKERELQQQVKNLEVARMRLKKMKEHIDNNYLFEALLDNFIMNEEESTLAKIENKLEGINQEQEGLKEEYKKMREIVFKRRLDKGKEVLEKYVYSHQSHDYFSKENQQNQEASSSDHQKTLQRFAEVLTLRQDREPQSPLRRTGGSIFPRTPVDHSSDDSNLSQSERNLRTEESLRDLMYSEESKDAVLVGPFAITALSRLCKNPNYQLKQPGYEWVPDILTEKGFIDHTGQPSPAVRELADDGTLDKLNKWATEYSASFLRNYFSS